MDERVPEKGLKWAIAYVTAEKPQVSKGLAHRVVCAITIDEEVVFTSDCLAPPHFIEHKACLLYGLWGAATAANKLGCIGVESNIDMMHLHDGKNMITDGIAESVRRIAKTGMLMRVSA